MTFIDGFSDNENKILGNIKKRTQEKFGQDTKLYEKKVDTTKLDSWDAYSDILADGKIDEEEQKKIDKDEKNFIEFIITLCSFGKVKDTIDTDGNGKLEANEIRNFVKQSADLYGDTEGELSIEDFARYLEQKGILADEMDKPSTNNNPPPNNPTDPEDKTTDPTDPTGLKTKTGAELTTAIQAADSQLTSLLYANSNSLQKVGDKSNDYVKSVTSAEPALVSKMESAAAKKASLETTINTGVGLYDNMSQAQKTAAQTYFGLVKTEAETQEQLNGYTILKDETAKQLQNTTDQITQIEGAISALSYVKVPNKTIVKEGEEPVDNSKAYYAAIARNKEIDKLKTQYQDQLDELKKQEEATNKEYQKIVEAEGDLTKQIAALGQQLESAKATLDKLFEGSEKLRENYNKKMDEYKTACKDYNDAKKAVMEDIAKKLADARAKELEEKKTAKEEQEKIKEAFKAEQPNEEQEKIKEKYDVPAEPKELRDSLEAYNMMTVKNEDGEVTGYSEPIATILGNPDKEAEIIRQYGSVYNYLNVVSLYGTKNDEGTELADSPHLQIYSDGFSSQYTEAELDGKTRQEIEDLLNTAESNDKAFIQAYLHTQLLEEGEEDAEFIILAQANGWIDADGETSNKAWEITVSPVEGSTEATKNPIDATAVDNFFNRTGFDNLRETKKARLQAEKTRLEAEKTRLEAEKANPKTITIDEITDNSAGSVDMTPITTAQSSIRAKGEQETDGSVHDPNTTIEIPKNMEGKYDFATVTYSDDNNYTEGYVDYTFYQAQLDTKLSKIDEELAELNETTVD